MKTVTFFQTREACQKAYDRMVTAFMGDPNVVEVGDPDSVSVEGV